MYSSEKEIQYQCTIVTNIILKYKKGKITVNSIYITLFTYTDTHAYHYNI